VTKLSVIPANPPAGGGNPKKISPVLPTGRQARISENSTNITFKKYHQTSIIFILYFFFLYYLILTSEILPRHKAGQDDKKKKDENILPI